MSLLISIWSNLIGRVSSSVGFNLPANVVIDPGNNEPVLDPDDYSYILDPGD